MIKITDNFIIVNGQRFGIEKIWRTVNNIMKKAERLSSEYSGNAFMPLDLGQDFEAPIFIRGETNYLTALLNSSDPSKFSESRVIDAINAIRKAGTGKGFEAAYYGRIASYYGIKTGPKATKEALKGNKLRAPAERSRVRYSDSDLSRYANWIIENIPNANPNKIYYAMRIGDLERFNYWAQYWELNQKTPPDLEYEGQSSRHYRPRKTKES